MNNFIKLIASYVIRWAVSVHNSRPRGRAARVISDYHIKWLRGESVYVIGRSDDGLLVRCWIPDIQLEINLNPACLE